MSVETVECVATADVVILGQGPMVVHLGPLARRMSDEEFLRFCQANRDLRIERGTGGEVVIMAPAGGETGNVESALIGLLYLWAQAEGTGLTFSSATGFTLPNTAVRSPDAAWVKRSRWARLSAQERKRFPPVCPDFVAEIRSESDSLPALQAKMREYLENGARLGWLIDPVERKVCVYRPGAEVECLNDPEAVSGDPVLPGFTLDLRRLWPPTA